MAWEVLASLGTWPKEKVHVVSMNGERLSLDGWGRSTCATDQSSVAGED